MKVSNVCACGCGEEIPEYDKNGKKRNRGDKK